MINLEKIIQFQSLWNNDLGSRVTRTSNFGCLCLWLGGTGSLLSLFLNFEACSYLFLFALLKNDKYLQ
jgi:hypothetical protein